MAATTLYLVRHEEADDHSADEHRALTERGRRRIHTTARLLAQLADDVDLMLSSPLVRAVQTAEIVASELGFDGPLLIAPELAGPVSLERLARYAHDAPAHCRGVMLVGHEPILGGLIGHCLGRPSPGVTRGEIHALALDPASQRFTYRWRIDPSGPTRTDHLER